MDRSGGGAFQAEGTIKCKGPEVGTRLFYLRNDQERREYAGEWDERSER